MYANYCKNSFQIIAATYLVILLLSGCQAPKVRAITEQDLDIRYQSFLRFYSNDINELSKKSLVRISTEYRNAKSDTGSINQSYDVLVLSGGGAFGAFGAGFLHGWGKVKEKEFSRPKFDTVSGVSTGALIAPFAFIGTKDAYRKIIELYENPENSWVQDRGIIPLLPNNVSIFDVSNLRNKIRSVVTSNLISKIGDESKKNRQLLIGATNIDYGLMRVWDLTKIASEINAEKAARQINSILFASSAIPGFFPPVSIDDFLYVDGGATMQVVGVLDDRSWLYKKDTNSLEFVDGARPIRIRIWIIVNQKLLPDHKVVRSGWTSIADRSLSILLRASTLQTIQDIETHVRLINQLPEFDAKMRYVAIPQDYQIEDSDNMFDAEIMRKLTALGQKMGADLTSWKTKALRPGAPF